MNGRVVWRIWNAQHQPCSAWPVSLKQYSVQLNNKCIYRHVLSQQLYWQGAHLFGFNWLLVQQRLARARTHTRPAYANVNTIYTDIFNMLIVFGFIAHQTSWNCQCQCIFYVSRRKYYARRGAIWYIIIIYITVDTFNSIPSVQYNIIITVCEFFTGFNNDETTATIITRRNNKIILSDNNIIIVIPNKAEKTSSK